MEGIQIIPLEIHADPRGFLFNPLEIGALVDQPVCHFHIYTIEPGAIRGNHYHTDRSEWLFGIGGQAKLFRIYPEDRSVQLIHEFLDQQAVMIEIDRFIPHFLYNDSGSRFTGASFSTVKAQGMDTKWTPFTPDELKEMVRHAGS